MYLEKLFNLEGKVAAVIGGGGYLCSAMAKGLASAGCAVAIIDLRLEKAEAVCREIEATIGCKVAPFALDASKKEQHVEVLEEIRNNLGDVEILINGAGINSPTPVLEISS